MNYEEKLSEHIPKTNYNHLPLETQLFIKEKVCSMSSVFKS